MSDEFSKPAPEGAEEFVAQTIDQPEIEEPKERTRESEIQANMEFWKGLAQDINFKLAGIQVNEAEIRTAIEDLPEVEGFDWYLTIPKDVRISLVYDAIQSQRGIHSGWDPAPNTIRMPRNAQETYAVAARYSQKPDEDSLGENAKSALDWEKTGETYMTPLELAVAELRWHTENGTHLDEDTFCPGSRTNDGGVPFLSLSGWNDGKARYGSINKPEKLLSGSGVRRVVTKDTKVKEESVPE